MISLSARQADCLEAIRTFIRDKGYSPTQAELAETMNVSASVIEKHLSALQTKGYISRAYATPRSIVVLAQ